MIRDAWAVAIETLSWMDMRVLNERSAFAKTIRQLGIKDPQSLKLAYRLVHETVKRINFIDRFVGDALKPSVLEDHTLGLQAFLRLYVCQMRMATRRDRSDLREAEDIAKVVRGILGWQTVRAVEPFLGTLLTKKLSSVFEQAGDEERVGLQTFHPVWYINYCYRLFGRNETIAILEGNMGQPSTYIRVNTLKGNEDGIVRRIAEEGAKVRKIDSLKNTYEIIETKQPLTKIDSYQEGLFFIQDKASCLATEIACPKQGMTVLDVCAAPGAKTTHLAQLMQNVGRIYSLDYSKRRMSIWRKEVSRMGVKIAQPIIADARWQLPTTAESDLVILDPPCTGTGTFRKVPSSKWRLSPDSIERMTSIQRLILDNCAMKVKDGGALVYSTCSLTVEENEMQIERFLKRNSDFSLMESSPTLGLPGLRGLDKCQRLYPHLHDCNGFFIARLRKD